MQFFEDVQQCTLMASTTWTFFSCEYVVYHSLSLQQRYNKCVSTHVSFCLPATEAFLVCPCGVRMWSWGLGIMREWGYHNSLLSHHCISHVSLRCGVAEEPQQGKSKAIVLIEIILWVTRREKHSISSGECKWATLPSHLVISLVKYSSTTDEEYNNTCNLLIASD